MSITPFKSEWLLGRDEHNRLVSLVREIDAGKARFTVIRTANNQRDDTVRLDGISLEMMTELGKIAQALGPHGHG